MKKPQSSTFPEFTIIVGTGRSGTTYLVRMLRQGAGFGIPAEPKFVVAMYRDLDSFGDLNQEENLHRLVTAVQQTPPFQHLLKKRGIPSSVKEIYPHIQEPSYTGVLYAAFTVLAEKWGGTRLGYKDPQDLLNMPTLAEIFPTARFVHIIRDGRDYAISVIRQIWGPNNLYSGMVDWRKRLLMARQDVPALGDRYFELRYEDLILDTEATCYRLGSFICPPLSQNQIGELIDRVNATKQSGNVYGWKRKLDSRDQRLCEAVAGDMLANYDYIRRFEDASPLAIWTKWAYAGDDLLKRGIHILKRRRGQ